MLCPRCNSVFDKRATKDLEGFIPKSKKRGKWYVNPKSKFSFTKSYIPFISNFSITNYVNKNGKGKTFVTHAKAPVQKWVHSTQKNIQYGKNNVVKGSTSTIVTKNVDVADTKTPNESRKYAYSNNYKGKNHMTRTQWRMYQRSKKVVVADLDDNTVDPKGKQKVVETTKRRVKERLSLPPVEENPTGDDEMDSEPNFDVICNVVSIFPEEYDVVPEVEESEDNFNPVDIEKYRPMCYYVTNYGCVVEQKAMFEKPDGSMKGHLKPLFIQVIVDDIGLNKVLVDDNVVVNLMP